MWGRSQPEWYFEGTQDILDVIDDAEPNYEHVELEERDEVLESGRDIIDGRKVTWLHNTPYTVLVPVEKIQFMEGNLWNMPHAAALLDEAANRDVVFEVPAARFYRIDADDVARTSRYEEEDELSYQVGMEKPWDEYDDEGTFYVQLVDGNHRAAAAMLMGEEVIPVTVGENYREDVLEEEWVPPA
jgi:hypothetical protein